RDCKSKGFSKLLQCSTMMVRRMDMRRIKMKMMGMGMKTDGEGGRLKVCIKLFVSTDIRHTSF
ncbi:hypothetical protein LWT57_24005, partial [Enterobacter cloacae]|uniref:hypothetical protein n=1 Tax=Enterobacter cloacae TaxID=550 RepID=UPI001E4B9F2A